MLASIARRDEDPGSTEAALERVVPAERILERGQRTVSGEALDGHELRAVDLCREEETRADGRAVESHRARAADTVLATHVRAREAEPVAEEVGEENARFDLLAVAPAVHRDVDGDHAARSLARATTRSTRTRTS